MLALPSHSFVCVALSFDAAYTLASLYCCLMPSLVLHLALPRALASWNCHLFPLRGIHLELLPTLIFSPRLRSFPFLPKEWVSLSAPLGGSHSFRYCGYIAHIGAEITKLNSFICLRRLLQNLLR